MTWTRALLAALAVCVLVLTGTVSCGSGAPREPENPENMASPSPVGKVLDDTDEDGRHYREVDDKDAPEVDIEVQPDTDASWDVRLTVRNFRFSPAGVKPKAVEGRGLAYIFVDGTLVSRQRTLDCRIPAHLVPRGTHTVTVRLYADDGTVWVVDGDPVESAADITASGAEASTTPSALSAPGTFFRTGGRGSPDPGGKAS
ncbi:hypothetical protein [Streptomyces sp. S.PB5]|uniref:hypothetical protein n=1 Tax=Streptomyces sp. S.PB5 TaxID=3020844 RepID=UPI0025AFEF39|nr:hypothetical protein [Streptomyces sp. S.PB5]MDN3022099.1 hypothetical protein [Streptomyces sp. S.PB5]